MKESSDAFGADINVNVYAADVQRCTVLAPSLL